MTIAIKGNSQGGVVEANGVAAANVSSASGIPFCKNKLFNGEVTRINQRQFDGNWTPKNIWNAGNTVAQQELCYGYDMWAKASATTMCQLIEAGNFRPNTVHTLSGIGVTTQQITSPASGNWKIEVPQGATNVQVEEGLEATPFEVRPISFELAQCRRYYQLVEFSFDWYASVAGQIGRISQQLVPKRVVASIGGFIFTNNINLGGFSGASLSTTALQVQASSSNVGNTGCTGKVPVSAVI